MVLSVRDLVRQIPAEWQENVKHRAAARLRRASSTRSATPSAASRIATWFWGVQEIPDILDRWGQRPAAASGSTWSRCRRRAARPTLLWQRFSQAFGLDGLDLDLEAERANPSLGVPETALLRRINRTANRSCRPARLPAAGARAARPPDAVAAHRARRGSRCRRTLHPWVQRAVGVVGRGDRAPRVRRGRRPRRPGRRAAGRRTYADPDQPDERQVAAAALDAITALLLENAPAARDEEERLPAELADAHGALERAYLRPTYRLAREDRCGGCEGSRARAAGCSASTGGRGAGARGRRSGRSARSTKPSAPSPTTPPTTGTRRPTSWPAACRRPG